MTLLARFEETGREGERRESDRRALRLTITANLADIADSPVTIHDLSESGMLLEAGLPLATGERFEAFLPLVGAVEATVVWNSGDFYGCQFAGPVPRAAVSAALLKSVPNAAPAKRPAAASEDLLSQLRDLNSQVDDIGVQLDRTIDRLASGGRSAGAGAKQQSSAREEIAAENVPPRDRYSDRQDDAGRSIVIFMLILAGLAVLIFAFAMLGSPLNP